MNYTEVKPVEPIIKPNIKPKREIKPRPDKNDPWTVPAPRINPTPKASDNTCSLY